jgi:hypothetical protein
VFPYIIISLSAFNKILTVLTILTILVPGPAPTA